MWTTNLERVPRPTYLVTDIFVYNAVWRLAAEHSITEWRLTPSTQVEAEQATCVSLW